MRVRDVKRARFQQTRWGDRQGTLKLQAPDNSIERRDAKDDIESIGRIL